VTPAWRKRLSWSGLWLGAAAWGVSLQTTYSLVPLFCGGRGLIGTAIAAGLVLVALAGGVLSLRVARMPLEAEWVDPAGGLPHRFVAWIGVGAGLVFALAIANQLAATLVVDGCLR
jgi:hypothetical protein